MTTEGKGEAQQHHEASGAMVDLATRFANESTGGTFREFAAEVRRRVVRELPLDSIAPQFHDPGEVKDSLGEKPSRAVNGLAFAPPSAFPAARFRSGSPNDAHHLTMEYVFDTGTVELRWTFTAPSKGRPSTRHPTHNAVFWKYARDQFEAAGETYYNGFIHYPGRMGVHPRNRVWADVFGDEPQKDVFLVAIGTHTPGPMAGRWGHKLASVPASDLGHAEVCDELMSRARRALVALDRAYRDPDGPLATEFRRMSFRTFTGDESDASRRSASDPDRGQQSVGEDEAARNLKSHATEAGAVILQGPPGTGKTRLALQLVELLATGGCGGDPLAVPAVRSCQLTAVRGDRERALSEEVVWEIVQLHPGYAYEDLVRGLVASPEGGFRPRDGIVVEMARLARLRGDKPTILILDEINRCNLAAVLGELILVVERGYRGLSVKLQYAAPREGHWWEDGDSNPHGDTLMLPENLWIVGTMNTADRSIAMVDFAIRRRFRFLDVLPDPAILEGTNGGAAARAGQEAYGRFSKLLRDSERGRLAIGHSYFIVDGAQDEDTWSRNLARRLIYEVLPLAREYAQEGLLERTAVDLGHGVDVRSARLPDGFTVPALAATLRAWGRG
jgi:hypothetical protein